MSEMDSKKRWKIEAEHHDHIYKGVKISAFDATSFYNTRPYGIKMLLDKLGDCRGRKVLDVGAGLGLFSRYFTCLGAKVYALDISLEALKAIDPHLRIERIYCAGEFLPFKAESFDIIFGAAVLHHLEIPAVAQEFHRVLKPGGQGFFYESLGYNPIINFYRILTPSIRTPTERPILLEDLRPFQKSYRRMDVEFYHLLAVIPQGIGVLLGLLQLPGKKLYRRIQGAECWLARIDRVIFRAIPIFKKWGEVVVISFRK